MNTRPSPRRRTQQGVLALVLAAALGVGAVAAFTAGLTGTAARQWRERTTDRALQAAREALVAYAAGRPIDAVVGPGYLPCPDLDNDGWAESTCGSQSGDSGQAQRLGRLPWKSLGIPDLRDGSGERLWYAVSSKHKGLLNCTVSEACLDMSPDAAIGTITVRDARGAVIHDGRGNDLYRAQSLGALAVVLAPGPALRRVDGHDQLRACVSGECTPSGRCTAAPPARAAACQPRNFLDLAPGGEDNAAFVDRNDAAGRFANGDGFIAGPVRLPDGSLAVNDRVAALTYDDVMPAVMRRVGHEALSCLRAFAQRPENAGRLPSPAPLCRQAGFDSTLAWRSEPGARFGRVPEFDAASCALGQGPGLSWWRAWRLHVFLALVPGGGLEATDAAGRPLGAARDAAVIVAGAPLGATAQSHGPGTQADAAQWLEGPHRELTRLDAGTETPGCPAAPVAPPCTNAAPCNRVVLAARSALWNDVVVTLP